MSRESVREEVDRQWRQGEEMQARVAAAIDVLPLEALRDLARLYAAEVRYLGDHFPQGRRNVRKFPCTNDSYHGCSFTGRHDPGCKAIGGDGDVSANGFKHARSCEADCEAAGTDEPWCNCSGFDCPTCEMVDRLLGLLVAHGAMPRGDA